MTSQYRVDLIERVDEEQGVTYWAWILNGVDSGVQAGGRVDELAGRYDLDGNNDDAECVCDQICHQLDIDRADVMLSMGDKSW
jgi:hypothetical protein